MPPVDRHGWLRMCDGRSVNISFVVLTVAAGMSKSRLGFCGWTLWLEFLIGCTRTFFMDEVTEGREGRKDWLVEDSIVYLVEWWFCAFW